MTVGTRQERKLSQQPMCFKKYENIYTLNSGILYKEMHFKFHVNYGWAQRCITHMHNVTHQWNLSHINETYHISMRTWKAMGDHVRQFFYFIIWLTQWDVLIMRPYFHLYLTWVDSTMHVPRGLGLLLLFLFCCFCILPQVPN